MKRYIIILAAIAIACACSSCQKEKEREGVYHPKKKISKIYEERHGAKRLVEEWTWNGKNLSKITNADKTTSHTFKYEKNRISKIECTDVFYVISSPYYHSYTLSFIYEGDFIKKIECHEEGGRLSATYNFKHTQDKITTLTIEDYIDFGDDYNKNAVAALRPFLPIQMVKSMLNRKRPTSLSKGETYISTYEFEWEGDNIKTETFTNNTWTEKTTYKYDDKINPYYNFFENFAHSKNNATYAEMSYFGGIDTTYYISTYDITYDGKFPVKIVEARKERDSYYDYVNYTTTYYVYKK